MVYREIKDQRLAIHHGGDVFLWTLWVVSKDIYSVDEQIPSSMGMYLRCLVLSGSTLLTILYVTPMFAVLLGPILVSYIYSQRYFIHTSRELQRLDSISRSPLYSLLGETLDGLVTMYVDVLISQVLFFSGKV